MSELVPFEVGEDVEKFIEATQSVTTEDPEQIAYRIMAEILQADSVTDVLSRQEVMGARDVLAVPMEFRGVKFNRSDYEGGPGVYAIADVVNLGTGEAGKVSCGSKNVMAQLYRIAQLDGFPFRARFEESGRPTAQGYRPLWLQALPG